jgi:quercetin dioxygenase-like cupin family protein
MFRTLAPMLVLSLLTLALAQSKTPQGWNARTIQWQTTDKDGTKWAVLQGRSDVPGEAFTYAAFIPAGYHDRHSHSSDARVAVVQGALTVGFGNDPSRTETYRVGSLLFVPANLEHTMAAEEDTILIGTATGPWNTHHHEGHEHH